MTEPSIDSTTKSAERRIQSRKTRTLQCFLFVALTATTILFIVREVIESLLPPLPPAPPVYVNNSAWDGTLVWFTITRNWKRLPFVAPILAIRSDEGLWLRMYLRNWDTVPAEVRDAALETMFKRYKGILAGPKTWDRMNAEDWDLAPQPMRALTYRHMMEYWSGYYGVGKNFGIPRRLMSDTLSAILMGESWFEHRAVNSIDKNRDIGVAQASDYARARMRVLYRDGRVDVLLRDDDYFDPWKGTRFLAVWMNLMLDEVGGDLDMAIRAYHVGSAEASAGEGLNYLNSVKRYRRFLREPSEKAPAWRYLLNVERATARSLSDAANPS